MQPMLSQPRIHIIGGAGSGKTTFARRLSVQLGALVYDLDCIAYEECAGPKRNEAHRREAVQCILAEPRWVTEGLYLWWTEDLLRTADVIIWLDVPWRVAAWRIIRRHIAASYRGTNKHPGWRHLVRFLLRTRAYYYRRTPAVAFDACDDLAISRTATALALAPYCDKVVRTRR